MLEIALGVALGIILAVLILKYWDVALVIGIVLVVIGAFGYFLVLPAVSTYMKVTAENPNAAYAYFGLVGMVGVIATGFYLWDRNRKKPKE